MTRNKNYLKIVGSQSFVEEAKKKIEHSFLTIFESEIKVSSSDPGVYFAYLHCAEKPENANSGLVRQDQARTATANHSFNLTEAVENE